MDRIYFDNAATTPLLPEVKKAMIEVMDLHYGNPSSIHYFGRNARSIIEENRKLIASHLNCSPSCIIFTSGGTEASNLILSTAIQNHGVQHIITSQIEHPCILNSLKEYTKKGISIDYINVDENHCYDVMHLDELLKKQSKKTMVCLMHVNNEIGSINDILTIANLSSKYNSLYFADTTQSIGFIPLNTQLCPIDFCIGSAHKFHGPKGVGFAYLKKPSETHPIIYGGGQERGLRSGTENLIGIAGMGAALDYMSKHSDQISQKLVDLNHLFRSQLNLLKIQPEWINKKENSISKILTLRFPNFRNSDLLVLNLDIHGIAVSGGSACSSGAEKASHVMEYIFPDTNGKIVRFSFSFLNTKDEVENSISVLQKILQ